MNFLAHLYLSGSSAQVKTGNFIADYVKGNQYNNYPDLIRKGILMHRYIDSFTDTHPLALQGKVRLRSNYGKYSGVVTDIFFDHLLSVNWEQYSTQPINDFISDAHIALLSNFRYLPTGMKTFLPHFILYNRLKSYSQFKGVEFVLKKMAYRFKMPEFSEFAVEVLMEYYPEYTLEFNALFPELIEKLINEFPSDILQPSKWKE